MTESNVCRSCGAPITPGTTTCIYCGQPVAAQAPVQQAPANQQPTVFQPPVYQQPMGADASWPVKNRIAAGILAIFFGAIGAQKFYLGQGGKGLLCLVFFWTWIPAILGVIEGIVCLTSSDYAFSQKYHVRVE